MRIGNKDSRASVSFCIQCFILIYEKKPRKNLIFWVNVLYVILLQG
jgi:hypothetical protein